MKLINLLKRDDLSLSFEVFPPKADSSFDSVKAATEEIAKLKPAFMSVTYGAGGGTSEYTLEIAKNIKDMYGVCHFGSPYLRFFYSRGCAAEDRPDQRGRYRKRHGLKRRYS